MKLIKGIKSDLEEVDKQSEENMRDLSSLNQDSNLTDSNVNILLKSKKKTEKDISNLKKKCENFFRSSYTQGNTCKSN